MPKRTDIQSILILGAGPIVIGQACEFDYSGVQACKVLNAEGYRVILINSNPATIMTDPEFAQATYVEPLTVETVDMVLAKERPDAILPTAAEISFYMGKSSQPLKTWAEAPAYGLIPARTES